MLGLPCCAGFCLVAASGDGSLGVGCRLHTVVASLVERGPQDTWASAEAAVGCRAQAQLCGAQAWCLCSTWDPASPGIEPASPALAGRLSTAEPPGKSPSDFLDFGGS